MPLTVISVEDISKAYRLGSIGTGTFYGDLKRWWARQRGLPDPYLTIEAVNHHNRDGDNVWALKDVSFTVQQGEAVGIIGRNGAGKSTILKILSQVTAPTSGVIKVKGNIASLLEVGTGFHPELTGRENIYMNGAIMGMNRAYINRRFDEIVDFSGVEKYIDTPVKRYSSGMYVRLAFAVAAHLEPEILIVDEVLAVGDAAFQKKCLGKMENVTNEGRTVLFVSHNMGAIRQLCPRAILLNEGKVSMDGITEKVVSRYLSLGIEQEGERVWPELAQAPGDHIARLRAVRVLDRNDKVTTEFDVRDPITIEMEFWVLRDREYLDASFYLSNERGELVLVSINTSQDRLPDERRYSVGLYKSRCIIPSDFLNDGQFYVQANLGGTRRVVHTICRDVLNFQIGDRLDPLGARGTSRFGEWPPSAVRPRLQWVTERFPLENELVALDPALTPTNKG